MAISEREFIARRAVPEMGRVDVALTIENATDPSRRVETVALVDTGATGLFLPLAWKERLAPLWTHAVVDVEMADQRVATGEVCGHVVIQIDGFRRMTGEAIFVDMQPRADGSYEPLVGHVVLQACNLMVDPVDHCLVARKYYDLERAAAA